MSAVWPSYSSNTSFSGYVSLSALELNFHMLLILSSPRLFFLPITCFSHASGMALGTVDRLTTLVQTKKCYWMDWHQILHSHSWYPDNISPWLWLSHLEHDIYGSKRNVSKTIGWAAIKLVQTLIFPSRWIVITLMISWLFFQHHHQVKIVICPTLWFKSKY